MRFRILGPLRVRSGGRWMVVAAEQQRVVLAVLLVQSGRTVCIDTLIDALWGERPPRSATNTVQAYVSRLRRLVGAEVLTTRQRGYVLAVGDDDIDAGVFEQQVRRGRRELAAGRPAGAEAALGQALALWDRPQPVLADVPPSPWVDALAIQLEQLRLGAADDHAEACLQLGRHADLAEELDHLAREHPLRERRWALLMTALERCGRRAEALEAYQRARRVLTAELGLEPGQQLRELQQGILADGHGNGRRRRSGSPAGGASPAVC
jgi:DNA-binding SARP family transcriptional activator